MRTDTRLPRILHVLLHLHETDVPITSERIGRMLGMNPSLVRRTMGGLREAGIVGSTKGHGGGWYLEKRLADITLSDVYDALGEPCLFAVGTSDDTPTCLLEQAANTATESALEIARASFLGALDETTVADLVEGSRKPTDESHRCKG
ncbi:RrF2 family transcriptional regulator [Bauldia sp.]|uniref:RrF2 family transcriptional regulator n=1 Tax=Bauldia sp. TaxID=2575872 RepID=UPI003BAAF1C8